MKLIQRIAGICGLTFLVGLVVYQGLDGVAEAMLSVGWGLAAVSLFHIVPLVTSALAWREVCRPSWPGGPIIFAWARMVREAVNGLLPVAQIGGDFVGARVLTFHGARANVAGASVVVDMTLELITQLGFTAMGLCLLVILGGGGMTALWAFVGLAVAVLLVAGFLLAQRWGLFKLLERWLERLAVRFNCPALRSLENLHDRMIAIYRSPVAMARATSLHFAAWVLGAGEVWLAAHFMDFPLSPVEALVVESLGQAIRTAGFLVPGGFGVQEGGYLVVAAIFGATPEVGLSISLIKRVRDLAWGVPALLGWQLIEGRRLVNRGEIMAEWRPEA